MGKVTVTISSDLSAQLGPYRDSLDELIRIGLREVKKEQSLALYRKGGISLWRAARLASVSLREMAEYVVAQGVRAAADEETIAEELA